MNRFLNTAILAAALLATPSIWAEDRKYHDAAHNDDHTWNSHEDKAYRIWVKDQHRKYVNFEALKEEDRQAYWAWRHDHDDAALKITIK